MKTIFIGQECDGFFITTVDGNGIEKQFRFSQEDTVEDMVALFEYLGFENVVYEEVY